MKKSFNSINTRTLEDGWSSVPPIKRLLDRPDLLVFLVKNLLVSMLYNFFFVHHTAGKYNSLFSWQPLTT
jgi:hypothetical protein